MYLVNETIPYVNCFMANNTPTNHPGSPHQRRYARDTSPQSRIVADKREYEIDANNTGLLKYTLQVLTIHLAVVRKRLVPVTPM
mmetsp:Transcript_20587/g.33519  ORF Transcript_20587/g.33519 Transcript_20587/m.33519 type:complete len:84 (+) Transcript_20587:1142-1393(+)